MHPRSTTVAVIFFVLLIIGMFVFSYLKREELKRTDPLPEPATEEPGVPYQNVTRIDAKHFFEEGTHTLVGEIPFPTPCDLLDWDVLIAESYPEQVTIDFVVINNAEMCAQVVTNQRFRVSFDASEDATIRARFMGRAVELNRIPPAEGESPDDFELFIKG